MWIQGIVIALPRVQYAWEIDDRWIGLLSSSTFAGMMLGSMAWGAIADAYGRHYAFSRTLVVTAVFGALLSVSPGFAWACLWCFCLGTGVGGSMPTDGTFFLESLPRHKQYWLTALSVFFSLGSVVCAVLALVLLPGNSCTVDHKCAKGASNTGWRYLLGALAALTAIFVLVRIVLFRMFESPKYLVAEQRHHEAREILQRIASYNGQTLPLRLSDVDDTRSTAPGAEQRAEPEPNPEGADEEAALMGDQVEAQLPRSCRRLVACMPASLRPGAENTLERAAALFSTRKLALSTVLVWSIWALLSLAFTMFNVFFPIFLQRKLGSAEASETSTLLNYLLYAVSSVPGSLAGAAMVETRLGRTGSLSLALALTIVAMLLFLVAQNATTVVLSSMLVSLTATTAYGVLYGYTPEVFPTRVRGTAGAVASALGRLTGIIAPLVAGSLLYVWELLPVVLSMLVFALTCLLAMLLPIETRVGVDGMGERSAEVVCSAATALGAGTGGQEHGGDPASGDRPAGGGDPASGDRPAGGDRPASAGAPPRAAADGG